MKGQWVTARVRVLHTDVGSTQVPRLSLLCGTPYSTDARNAVVSANWQTLTVEFFVPAAATDLTVNLVARNAAAQVNPVYFSDLSLTIGANAHRVPANLPYHTVVP
jgi:hypothetical protein